MTELGTVLEAYLTLVDCHTVTVELLRKYSKGPTFHGTVFMGQPPDKTKRLLAQAKTELDDWAIVGLVSIFEHILFNHEQSPLRRKSLRKGAQGFNAAIKPFEKRIPHRTYEDVTRLGDYRHWVAHGKRWGERPPHADPVSAHQQLVNFLTQAGLETKAHD
ncbi:MAG: hypothetical protein HY348_03420 [Nitrospira defluvii]|nr:hypothetical protein [Nitrospira defluvii]